MTCFCLPSRRTGQADLPCEKADPDQSKRAPAPAPRPWQIAEPFESAREQPPAHAVAAAAAAASGSSPSPHKVAVDLARQMLAANVDVASLEPEDMLVKFGAAWTTDNCINPSTLIGAGAVGRVHRGSRCGAPAAFKVMNQLSSVDALLRFARKSVLGERPPRTELPRHPHLLETLECAMFPPLWALLALSREAGEDVPTVDEACAPGPAAALSAPEMVIPALDYKGMRSARSLGSYGAGQLRAGSQLARHAQLEVISSPLEFGPRSTSSDEATGSARDRNAIVPAASPKATERSTCTRQAALDSETHSRGRVLSLGALSGPDSLCTFSLSRRPWDGPRLGGGLKPDRVRDIRAQFVVVTPLCDLGTLAAVVKGKAKVPVRALPPAIRAAYQAAAELASAAARPNGGGDGSSHARRASLATVRLAFLPPAFVELFKLQACLQALEGVAALHAASLVHCDLKPGNVLLQHSPDFAPFAVCAKIGDVDACRSLKRAAGGYVRAVPTGQEHSLRALSQDASRMRGTPGYEAPELMSFGRVSVETDVYALGATVMVALSTSAELVQADAFHMRFTPSYPASILPEVRGVLDACVCWQPKQRPGLADVRAALLRQLDASSAAAAGCGGVALP